MLRILALLFLCGCSSGGYNPSYIISDGEEPVETVQPKEPIQTF